MYLIFFGEINVTLIIVIHIPVQLSWTTYISKFVCLM